MTQSRLRAGGKGFAGRGWRSARLEGEGKGKQNEEGKKQMTVSRGHWTEDGKK